MVMELNPKDMLSAWGQLPQGDSLQSGSSDGRKPVTSTWLTNQPAGHWPK